MMANPRVRRNTRVNMNHAHGHADLRKNESDFAQVFSSQAGVRLCQMSPGALTIISFGVYLAPCDIRVPRGVGTRTYAPN